MNNCKLAWLNIFSIFKIILNQSIYLKTLYQSFEIDFQEFNDFKKKLWQIQNLKQLFLLI